MSVICLLQHLVVSNGGLGNGVSRESLLEVLKEGGTVESLLTPPTKPYAFVTYSSTQASQNAFSLLNGRSLMYSDQSVTLYFSYVERGTLDLYVVFQTVVLFIVWDYLLWELI